MVVCACPCNVARQIWQLPWISSDIRASSLSLPLSPSPSSIALFCSVFLSTLLSFPHPPFRRLTLPFFPGLPLSNSPLFCSFSFSVYPLTSLSHILLSIYSVNPSPSLPLSLSRSSSDESSSGPSNPLDPLCIWLVRQRFLFPRLLEVCPRMLVWDVLLIDARVLVPIAPACLLEACGVSGNDRPVSFSWLLPSRSALVAHHTDACW